MTVCKLVPSYAIFFIFQTVYQAPQIFADDFKEEIAKLRSANKTVHEKVSKVIESIHFNFVPARAHFVKRIQMPDHLF